MPRLPALSPAAPPVFCPEPPDFDAAPRFGRVNAWGAFAFFLAALAFLLATFALPRWLTVTSAGLGLLLGLGGVVASWGDWQVKDGVWLALGGCGSGIILFLALNRPAALSDRWGRDFEVPEPDLNKQVKVSRDNTSGGEELKDGERVSAETNAIRQGDILVRIDSAVVGRVPGQDKPILLIALYVANVGPLHDVTYYGQASGRQPAVARDSLGKQLSRRELGTHAKKAGQAGKVSLRSTHDSKDLVAVEAPWPGTAHVEVDIPAAAWGREGVCKFTIPASFIMRKNRRNRGEP